MPCSTDVPGKPVLSWEEIGRRSGSRGGVGGLQGGVERGEAGMYYMKEE